MMVLLKPVHFASVYLCVPHFAPHIIAYILNILAMCLIKVIKIPAAIR